MITPPQVDDSDDAVEPDRVLGTRFDNTAPNVQGRPEVAAAEVLPMTGFPLSLMILIAGGLLSLGAALLQLSQERGRHKAR